MRRVQLIVLVMVSGVLAVPSTSSAASGKQVTRQPAAQQSSTIAVAETEKRKAAVAAQTATAEERKIAARVRWVETQLQREEQLLAQRLAYANRLRAAGLQKNDEKVLKQAEDYERQALAAFQQRIAQYEKMLQTTSTGTSPTPAATPSSTPRRKTTTTTTRTRSSAKPHPQSRLIRRR